MGFDVVLDTRWGPPPHTNDPNEFGMVSENTWTGKFIDAALFRRHLLVESWMDPPPCGAWGWFDHDYNHNCEVELGDFEFFAESWMDCTMPGDPTCSHPWE